MLNEFQNRNNVTEFKFRFSESASVEQEPFKFLPILYIPRYSVVIYLAMGETRRMAHEQCRLFYLYPDNKNTNYTYTNNTRSYNHH